MRQTTTCLGTVNLPKNKLVERTVHLIESVEFQAKIVLRNGIKGDLMMLSKKQQGT